MILKGTRKESLNCGWMEALTNSDEMRRSLIVRFDCGFIREDVPVASFLTGNVRGNRDVVVGDILKSTSDGEMVVLQVSSRKSSVRFVNTGNIVENIQKDALLKGYVKDRVSKAEKAVVVESKAAERAINHIKVKSEAQRKREVAKTLRKQKADDKLFKQAEKLRLRKEYWDNKSVKDKQLLDNALVALNTNLHADQLSENPNDLNIDFKDRDGKWVLRYGAGGSTFTQTRLGRYHNNMTQRIGRGKAYGDVIISDEFLDAQKFSDWATQQPGWGMGYHLDKDLLGKGSRLYSADTCCFIPATINFSLAAGTSTKTIVTQCKDGWKVQFVKNNLKIFLGMYPSESEGIAAYRKYQEMYLQSLAIFYKNKISEAAFSALMSWKF